MDVDVVVGTSYAPGHNFWPGSPVSWWIRGTFAFVLVAGPFLFASLAGMIYCRRRRSIPVAAGVILALAIIWIAWPSVIGLRFKDGDMPWYRGLVLGYKARTWILLLAVPSTLTASLVPPPRLAERRGFPVELSTKQPSSRFCGPISGAG